MRIYGIKGWLFLVTVVAGATATTPALAQQSNGNGKEARRTQLESMAESEKALEKDVTGMSAEQKLEQAEKTVNDNKETLTDVQGRLQKAREGEKDISKINCISEKVAAIKGFLKVSEQSYVELKTAVDEGDSESANHHYTLVAISGQKVGNLQQQAKACIGQVERYAEGTKVDVEVDSALDDEPSYFPETTSDLERLPELTPFQ
jgi:hypothetical protein